MVWISVALLALAAVFLLLGLAHRRFEIENELVANAPREIVWTLFTDESRLSEWMPGLRQIVWLEGERLQPGSRWRLVLEEGGRTVEVTERLEEIDPPHSFRFSMETDPFVGSVEVRLEPTEGGTRVSARMEVRPRNLAYAALFGLMKGKMRAHSQQTYERLARAAESDAARG